MCCAHNPPPCHSGADPPTSFIQLLEPMCIIIFETRAVILRAWGSGLKPGQSFGGLETYFQDFWDDCVFSSKKVPSRIPPKEHSNPLLTVLWFDGFFGVLYAQEL